MMNDCITLPTLILFSPLDENKDPFMQHQQHEAKLKRKVSIYFPTVQMNHFGVLSWS